MGIVEDLLVDTNAGRAPFAIVNYGDVLGITGDATLVPINRIQLDTTNRKLTYKGFANDIKNGPNYKKDISDYSPFYNYWSGAETREREERELVEGRKGGEAISDEEVERRRRTEAGPSEGQVEIPFEIIIRRKTNQ